MTEFQRHFEPFEVEQEAHNYEYDKEEDEEDEGIDALDAFKDFNARVSWSFVTIVQFMSTYPHNRMS
jgi:beta-xylosidase